MAAGRLGHDGKLGIDDAVIITKSGRRPSHPQARDHRPHPRRGRLRRRVLGPSLRHPAGRPGGWSHHRRRHRRCRCTAGQDHRPGHLRRVHQADGGPARARPRRAVPAHRLRGQRGRAPRAQPLRRHPDLVEPPARGRRRGAGPPRCRRDRPRPPGRPARPTPPRDPPPDLSAAVRAAACDALARAAVGRSQPDHDACPRRTGRPAARTAACGRRAAVVALVASACSSGGSTAGSTGDGRTDTGDAPCASPPCRGRPTTSPVAMPWWRSTPPAGEPLDGVTVTLDGTDVTDRLRARHQPAPRARRAAPACSATLTGLPRGHVDACR